MTGRGSVSYFRYFFSKSALSFSASSDVMHDVWMGDRSYRDAIQTGDLLVEGDPALTRRIGSWLKPSVFANSERAPVPMELADAR